MSVTRSYAARLVKAAIAVEHRLEVASADVVRSAQDRWAGEGAVHDQETNAVLLAYEKERNWLPPRNAPSFGGFGGRPFARIEVPGLIDKNGYVIGTPWWWIRSARNIDDYRSRSQAVHAMKNAGYQIREIAAKLHLKAAIVRDVLLVPPSTRD